MKNIQKEQFYQYSDVGLSHTYIHLHWERIGLLNNSISVSEEMQTIYTEDRKNKIINSVKNDYATLIKKKNNTTDFIDLLADEKKRDQIINSMEKNMQQELDKILKENESASIKLYGLGQDLMAAIKEGAKKTENIIEIIMEGLSIIPQTDCMAIVYAQAKQEGKTIPQALKAVLQSFENRIIPNDEIQRAYNALTTFYNNYCAKENTSWDVKSLGTLLGKNIFSTAIGESVAFSAMLRGESTVKDILVEGSGTKTVKSAGYEKKIAGKTDIQLKGLTITITEADDPNKAYTINVGISEKFYLKQPWQTYKGSSGSFESGSGGKLGPAINLITNNDMTEKYYIYNILAHSKNKQPDNYEEETNEDFKLNAFEDITNANNQISRMLAARQIIRIFASATTNNNANDNIVDFSQFFFANGKLIPMYKIVLYTLNLLKQDINVRSSNNDIDNLAIKFHISDQAKWKPWIKINTNKDNGPVYTEASKRSSTIIKAIMNATITADIHIQKLLSSIDNLTY